MNSIAFVNEAQRLIKDIKDQVVVGNVRNDYADNVRAEQQIQRRIVNLYSTLYNPTLPSAFKLRDVALYHGYSIEGRVLQFLGRFG